MKSICLVRLIPINAILYFFILSGFAWANTEILYVDANAVGLNNGESWQNAYVYLQDALEYANELTKPLEIRVAQGTYRPDQGANQTLGDRKATFRLINGVTLIGGFAGLQGTDPNVMSVSSYETILSGDLSENDEDVNGPEEFLEESSWDENSIHVVIGSDTDATAVLTGFTVTAGNATGSYQPDLYNYAGGGMYCYLGSPTVDKCTFRRNVALTGGGMCNTNLSNPNLSYCTFDNNLGGGMVNNERSSPNVTHCTFSQNSKFSWFDASGDGGGMFNGGHCHPVVADCIFIGNSADFGGGMYSSYYCNPTLKNCLFIRNLAGMGGGIHISNNCNPSLVNCSFIDNLSIEYRIKGDGNGGGMSISSNSCPILTNCTFIGNSTRSDYGVGGFGGGLKIMESNPVLANCIISGNSAWRGGGLYCDYCSNPRLINCLITGNLAPTSWFEDKGHGGGIYSLDESTPMLINCTLVGNRAGYGNTLLCNTIRPNIKKSYIELLNCIIQDEGVGGQSMACSKGITINHCCVLDDWPGEGNIHANPLFVDPGYWDPNGTSENSEDDFWVDGDYRLLPDSPCIDAGDPNYVSDPNGTHLDIYGGPRLINGRLDIGADEYNPPEPSNLKSDGIINFKDFALLALNWRVDTCTQEQWFNGSDIDQNGKVEIFDLIGLMENWLEPVNWERAVDTVPKAAEIKGVRYAL